MATVTGLTAEKILAIENDLKTSLAGKASSSHAATHIVGGADPITIAQSQVTNLAADLATKAADNTVIHKGDFVVNVKDYGAIGDGIADDTNALASAIAAVPTLYGGVVYLPAGIYLLGGTTGLSIATAGTGLKGAGAEATKILIGGGLTDTAAIKITGHNCQILDLSVSGASSTTINNPAVNGINIIGVRRTKINRCTFYYVNGWAIEATATSASSTSNPLGTQINQVYMNACSGGIHLIGNVTQNYAMNCSLTDVQSYQGGVTSGVNANLDCLRIEDAWDILVENAILWQNAGTGSSLRIKGNSAASFINNLDALGPLTGVCVKIEDGPNGSPQNTQIIGGVIQKGNIGVQISGGSRQVHLSTTRIINNETHGLLVDGTATTIYVSEVFFSASGNGAAGTNYDINWSGTAVGFVTNCRFASPIVATGTPGVQQTINIATVGQNVRVINASFQGVGSTSTNWFTNLPSAVIELSSGLVNFLTQAIFSIAPSSRPSAPGNNAFAVNVNGTDAFDRFRILGNGNLQFGSGTATRDTTWGRQGAAQIGSGDSDIIIGLAGKGLRVKEGANARMGTLTLNGSTPVVVNNTSVTASSRIFLTTNVPGGTPGFYWISARTAGSSFSVTGTAGDTSTVAWMIFEPA